MVAILEIFLIGFVVLLICVFLGIAFLVVYLMRRKGKDMKAKENMEKWLLVIIVFIAALIFLLPGTWIIFLGFVQRLFSFYFRQIGF